MGETAVAGLDMKLVEIATAYQRSRVLCAAARPGVADALKEGERSIQEIARSCAAEPASIHRCCECSQPWASSRNRNRIASSSRNWVSP
jgi:hypothetical protein